MSGADLQQQVPQAVPGSQVCHSTHATRVRKPEPGKKAETKPEGHDLPWPRSLGIARQKNFGVPYANLFGFLFRSGPRTTVLNHGFLYESRCGFKSPSLEPPFPIHVMMAALPGATVDDRNPA